MVSRSARDSFLSRTFVLLAAFFATAFLFAIPLFHVDAQGATEVTVAPQNPDFVRYLQNLELGLLSQQAEEHAMGLIPSPVDLSHLT